jgi:hypothetical protein
VCNNRLILLRGLLVRGSATGIYKIKEPQDLQILIKSLSQLSLTLKIVNFALALRGLCCKRGDRTAGLTFLLSKICGTTHWKISSPSGPLFI